MFVKKFNIEAEIEDGTSYKAVGDFRDLRALEKQFPGAEVLNLNVTHLTYLAWNALKRTGQIKMTWEQFEAVCVFVADSVEDEDPKAGTKDQ